LAHVAYWDQMNKYKVLYFPVVTIEAETLDYAMDAAKKLTLTGVFANYQRSDTAKSDPGKLTRVPVFFDIAQCKIMDEDSEAYVTDRGDEVEYEEPGKDSPETEDSDG
jgi:hypothetical protein